MSLDAHGISEKRHRSLDNVYVYCKNWREIKRSATRNQVALFYTEEREGEREERERRRDERRERLSSAETQLSVTRNAPLVIFIQLGEGVH